MTKSPIEGIPKKITSQTLIGSNRDIVAFQLLDINPAQGKTRTANVPSKDYLYDAETYKTYEISYPNEIWFEANNGSTIVCDLRTKKGRELYEYLSNSNYNKSNPYRDKSVRAKFYVIDDSNKASVNIKAEEKKVAIKSKIIEMPTAKLRQLADYYTFDSRKEVQLLRLELLEKAEKEPEKVESALIVMEQDGEHLSTIIRAKRHNIIFVDTKEAKWRWGKDKSIITAYDLDLSKYQNEVRLIKFLQKADAGMKIYNQILNELDAFKDEYKA
jgi:hypothetical protein